MHDRCAVLEPGGRDIHAAAHRLRGRAPAVKVELPGGGQARPINSYDDLLRRFCADA